MNRYILCSYRKSAFYDKCNVAWFEVPELIFLTIPEREGSSPEGRLIAKKKPGDGRRLPVFYSLSHCFMRLAQRKIKRAVAIRNSENITDAFHISK